MEIALLEDKKLVELNQESFNKSFAVGDIYLGRITKVMSGLNAAFVDVGHEKDAFLHYLDLGPQFNSLKSLTDQIAQNKQIPGLLAKFKRETDLQKDGKIGDLLKKGDLIPVQIVKEPISTKGPRLSSELSIAGRYMVLVPFSDSVSVSKKIKSAEDRKRLKDLIQGLRPENFGFIIRTAAEGAELADLESDLNSLINKWKIIEQNLQNPQAQKQLLQELDKAQGILRDLLNDDFESILVDSQSLHDELGAYLQQISPEKLPLLKIHKGKLGLFETYEIDKQIKSSFGKTVNMAGGVYLVIEHTEALHVIDVNSGNRLNPDQDQETNALRINKEAASEIARQLRLRDMGGIIVIDFIDIKKMSHRKELLQHMLDAMKGDRAKHTILPLSKFGLMEITRQRVKPQLNIVTAEACPMCEGTGKVRPSILMVDDIENQLHALLAEQNEKKIRLHTHPFLAAYLTKGLLSKQIRWFLKYYRWIKVVEEKNYHIGEYNFLNGSGEVVDFKAS